MFKISRVTCCKSLRACLSSFCDTTKYFSKPRIPHESPIDGLVILTPLSTRIYYLKFDGVKHAGPSIEVIMLTGGPGFFIGTRTSKSFTISSGSGSSLSLWFIFEKKIKSFNWEVQHLSAVTLKISMSIKE